MVSRAASPQVAVEDLTTRARIRDAALVRFPVDGFAGTTVRAIAADAGVSPALVVHHFGSKQGLQQACDEYVIDALSEAKLDSMRQGTYREAGPVAAAYRLMEPLLRYLAWTLSTGGPSTARIFDDLLDEVAHNLTEGQRLGLVEPFDDVRRQAAVLVAMQLGQLILHEQYSRAMGVDTLTSEGLITVAPYALRVFSGRLFSRQLLDEAAQTVNDLNDRSPHDQTEET